MNKFFNRLEYGRRLLYEPIKRSYSAEDIKAMLGFLITTMGMSPTIAKNTVFEKVKITKLPTRQSEMSDYILKLAKQVANSGYNDISPLIITQEEIDSIMQLQSIREQKVMFIYLCFLKYRQAVDGNYSDCYVTVPRGEIQKAVGHLYSSNYFNRTIFHLRAKGFLTNKPGINEAKGVLIASPQGKKVFEIDDLRNLGMIWTAYNNPKYMHDKKLKKCSCCDAPFIDSATKNNTQLCSECKKLPQYRREMSKIEKS